MNFILAVSNQKGGVSKTTSTINVGCQLAAKAKCLLIDLDPQGNLTSGLGVEVEEGQLTVYEALCNVNTKVEDAIIATAFKVDLLPADISLAQGEFNLIANPVLGGAEALKKILRVLQKQYDCILIDCPPSLGMLTINALTAATHVLIPVQCQYFALKGLKQLLATIASTQSRNNPNLEILGVIPTQADNAGMTEDVIENLKALSERMEIALFPRVPKSIKFPYSSVKGQPISVYSKGSRTLINPYQEVVKHILKLLEDERE